MTQHQLNLYVWLLNCIHKISPDDFWTLQIQSNWFFSRKILIQMVAEFYLLQIDTKFAVPPNFKTLFWQHFIQLEAVSKIQYGIEHMVDEYFLCYCCNESPNFLLHRSINHCLCFVSVAQVIWFSFFFSNASVVTP